MVLGGLGSLLGAFLADLQASWVVLVTLGAVLGLLEVILEPLGAVLELLGAVLEPLGMVLRPLGVVLVSPSLFPRPWTNRPGEFSQPPFPPLIAPQLHST